MKQRIYNFRHNAVSFRFSNGNSIDAVFGLGTYSDNYNYDNFFVTGHTEFLSSSTVESMFTCSPKLTKKIEKKYGEQPLSRISIDDWLEIAVLIKREKKP